MSATERKEATTFKGDPLTVVGDELKVGDNLPAFTLTDGELGDYTQGNLKGKVAVISVVPSLDTEVCQKQTRRFNEEASKLSDDVVILTVSMDLPFAQQRFCAGEGLDQVVTASDYKTHEFGPAFGIRVKELGLLGRGVFVADKNGKLVHVQYVKEITDEPDYDGALAAVKDAL